MEFSSLPANELVRLCADRGSAEAWREFVRRFQRPIALAVLRTARCWGVQSSAAVDDLVQDTFLRLCGEDCRLLKNFVPHEDDSAIGYLKMVAANITHDKLRAEKTLKRGGAMKRQEAEPEEMEALFIAPDNNALDRSLQHMEIDRALLALIPRVLTERDRAIFWLYFQQGFSAREISEIKAVELSTKGVESSLHRTTQQVREALSVPTAKGNREPLAISKEKP